MNESTEDSQSERSIFLPHGRIGRLAFIFRFVIYIVLTLGFGLIERATAGTAIFFFFYYGYYLVVAFLVITCIKRIHDIGHSGWAVLILGWIAPILMVLPGVPTANNFGAVPTRKL